MSHEHAITACVKSQPLTCEAAYIPHAPTTGGCLLATSWPSGMARLGPATCSLHWGDHHPESGCPVLASILPLRGLHRSFSAGTDISPESSCQSMYARCWFCIFGMPYGHSFSGGPALWWAALQPYTSWVLETSVNLWSMPTALEIGVHLSPKGVHGI